MGIKICTNCKSENVGSIDEGQVICADCAHKGAPIEFPSFESYSDYLRFKETEAIRGKPAVINHSSNRRLVFAIIMLVVIILSVIVLVSDETPKSVQVICNRPYILDGSSCCLDVDENGACDKRQTTTLLTTSIDITVSTTSTSSIITTSILVNCYSNADCGNVSKEYVCYTGDVYLRREKPVCRNPATAEAECIIKIEGMSNHLGIMTPYDTCGGTLRCYEGISRCQ